MMISITPSLTKISETKFETCQSNQTRKQADCASDEDLDFMFRSNLYIKPNSMPLQLYANKYRHKFNILLNPYYKSDDARVQKRACLNEH